VHRLAHVLLAGELRLEGQRAQQLLGADAAAGLGRRGGVDHGARAQDAQQLDVER
jgi:hypothetical protein